MCAVLIYYPFYKYNRSFIWQVDGFGQHFAILYNFNETIRNSIHNLGQGVSTFSWNIGIGSDIISEFSYYIIGDPFAYISLLFPMDKLEFAYNFLILLRMYLVGISFLIYSTYHKNKVFNSLIGAVIYTFCEFVLYAGVRHPFFLNGLIMLPIVFLGVDKILKENKSILFTVSIAIMAFMNYYLLYMVTVLAFIYGVIKYFVEFKDKNVKNTIRKLIKAALAYLLGIGIAAVVILPTVHGFINSNRLEDVSATYYSLSYYENLFGYFISIGGNFWTRICVSPLVILIIPVSIYRALKNKENRENRAIIINILVDVIMLLFAVFGSIMNGFSFQQNRWVFGLVFILAYMVTINIDKKIKFSKKEINLIIIVFLLYFNIVAIIEKVKFDYLIVTFFITLAMVIVIFLSNTKYGKKITKVSPYLVCVLVIVSIFNYSYQLYLKNNYAKEFKESNKVMGLYNSYNESIPRFGEAIQQIKNEDNSFYRISNSSSNTNINDSLIHRYKSLNEYLSIGNRYIGKLCKDLIILNYSDTNALKKLDSRTKITTLLANKYYVTTGKQKEYVPYGYSLYKELNDGEDNPTLIYRNNNALSIGNFYDSYILNKDFEKLSALEKEQAIVDTAVIDKLPYVEEYNLDYNKKYVEEVKEKTINKCKYSVVDSDNIVVDNNTITCEEENQSICLKVKKAVKNSELYIYIDNIQFKPSKGSTKYSVSVNCDGVTKKQNVNDKRTSPYYTKMPGILINLGYKDQFEDAIKITFSKKGKYKYNSIRILAVPMDVYEESINNLKKTEFKLTEYTDNSIKGEISNKKSGILQISTPYSKGWKAYVDGNETEIIKVNEAFIGIPLKEGNHQICIKYETPFLKLGILVTAISIVLFVCDIIYEKKIIKNKGRVKYNK